jgi:hypothetical protein
MDQDSRNFATGISISETTNTASHTVMADTLGRMGMNMKDNLFRAVDKAKAGYNLAGMNT